MRKQILIVAAHPDDEVLGCGGVAARHAQRGDNVDVLIVAEGATSRICDSASHADAVAALVEAANNAAAILGTQPPRFGGLPDNRLDSVALLDVTKLIEDTVVELRPDTVYTHHAGDLNIDHQLVARAAATALRPLPGASVQSLYSFETVSSTEWAVSLPDAVFQPTRFEDISAVFDLKCAALQCYSSEMHDFPHPRSIAAIEALARVRGATAGLAAAEAFCVIREIVA